MTSSTSSKAPSPEEQQRPRPVPRKRMIWALWAVLALLTSACGQAVSENFAGMEDAMETSTEETDGAEPTEVVSDRSGNDSDAAEFEAIADLEVDTDGADEAAPVAQAGTGETTAAGQTATQIGREIIFTAQVVVGVDDVANAGLQATQVIEDLGGFVFGQDSIGGNEPRTVLVFKVRPEDFQTALENLGGLGELRNQAITTDDVTERVVDLESRIQTTELGVERLRTAMENATDIADFAVLEQQLLARESDLEVLRGTLRTLRDQIDLSTITVTFVQDRVDNAIRVQYSQYEGNDAGARCPGAANDRFDSGDEATLCFEIVNNGDQNLSNITFTETALEIEDISDLTVVFGDIDDLAPGQSVMLATSFEVERSLNLRVNVTATPTTGATTEAVGPVVRSTSTPQLSVTESPNVAGFGDGFETGSALLANLWQVAQVLAGFFIPLLILLPIAWLVLTGLRRLFGRIFKKKAVPHNTTPPAPPAPPAPGTSPSSPTPPAPQGGDDDGDDGDDDRDDDEDGTDEGTKFVMSGSPSTVESE